MHQNSAANDPTRIAITSRPSGPGLGMAPGVGSSSKAWTLRSCSTVIANDPVRPLTDATAWIVPCSGTMNEAGADGAPATASPVSRTGPWPPPGPTATSSQRPAPNGWRFGPCITLNRRVVEDSPASQPVTGTVAPLVAWRSRRPAGSSGASAGPDLEQHLDPPPADRDQLEVRDAGGSPADGRMLDHAGNR